MRRATFFHGDDGAGGHGTVGDITGGSASVTEEPFIRDTTDIALRERVGHHGVDSVDIALCKGVAVEYGLLGKLVKGFLVQEPVFAGSKGCGKCKNIEYLFHIRFGLEGYFNTKVENLDLRIGLVAFVTGFRVDGLELG